MWEKADFALSFKNLVGQMAKLEREGKKKNVRRIEKVRRKTEKDRSIDFALKMFGNRFFCPCFSTKKNERKIQNCVLNFGGIAGALRLWAH